MEHAGPVLEIERRAELLSESLHFSKGNGRFHNIFIASEIAQDGRSQVRMQREIHRSCGERDDVWFKTVKPNAARTLGDSMQKVVRRQPEELRHNNGEKTKVVLIPRRS
jgi:hypothetical protein